MAKNEGKDVCLSVLNRNKESPTHRRTDEFNGETFLQSTRMKQTSYVVPIYVVYLHL